MKLVSDGDRGHSRCPIRPRSCRSPLVDVRDGGTVRHAREGEARARGAARRLRCVVSGAGAAVGAADRRLGAALADALASRPISRKSARLPGARLPRRLVSQRLLSMGPARRWPRGGRRTVAGPHAGLALSGLGRHVEIARMRGRGRRVLQRHLAGLCWRAHCDGARPFRRRGQSGAAKRRRPHPWLRGLSTSPPTRCRPTSACAHIPPDQLLRQVFETCRDYGEARTVLETHADRASGDLHAGRLPSRRALRHRAHRNGFADPRRRSPAPPTIGLHASRCGKAASAAAELFTRSYEEAAERSRARREALADWQGAFARESFAWIEPPVLNQYTRLGSRCARRGEFLRAVGYELEDGEVASPATLPCEVSAEMAADLRIHDLNSHLSPYFFLNASASCLGCCLSKGAGGEVPFHQPVVGVAPVRDVALGKCYCVAKLSFLFDRGSFRSCPNRFCPVFQMA